MGKRKRIIMSGLMLGGLCASLWALPGMLERVQGMTSGGAGLTGIPGLDGVSIPGGVPGLPGVVEQEKGKGLVLVVPSGEGLTAEARAALLREAEKQRAEGKKGTGVVRMVREDGQKR